MFLIRTAFWLSLVILLLPTESEGQRQLFGVARAAYSDISSFCVRNPSVCEDGKAVFAKFGEKAEFGFHMMKDIVYPSPNQPKAEQNTTFKSNNSTNTLKKEDLKPLWDLPDSNFGA